MVKFKARAKQREEWVIIQLLFLELAHQNKDYDGDVDKILKRTVDELIKLDIQLNM